MGLLIIEELLSGKKESEVHMLERIVQRRSFIRRAGFYFRRLRKEKLSRLAVVSVASLALILQLAAGVLPFTSTPVGAVGDDNLIRSGITSKEQLLAMYDRNSDGGGHADLKQIYTQFGVSRQDLASATMGSYKTNDFNGTLKTVGRTNWPNSGRTAVAVTGSATPVYTGPFLDGANSKPFVMQALIGKRSIDGQWFAITMNCGNVVYAVPPPAPPKPMAVVCTGLTVTRASRTGFTFTTQSSVKNATLKSITYVITDATGKEISRTTSATYTQPIAGTYTVKAFVNVVDATGAMKSVTSNACMAMFTVLPPAAPTSTVPKMCTIPGKEDRLATDRECVERVNPCVEDNDNHRSGDTSNGNSGRNTTSDDDDNCPQPVAPTQAPVMCTVPGKTDLLASSPNCVKEVVVTPPVTPTVLPQTGLGDDLLKVFGIGSLIASTGYYAASRRGLLRALLNR